MPEEIRVALCHLGPVLGDLAHNTATLERLLEQAARLGARWVLTPELALSGYDFAPVLGTDWIRPPEQDPAVIRLHAAARAHDLTLLLSHAVRDGDRAYNAVLALGAGPPQLVHRKLRTIPGVEDWSARGGSGVPAWIDGVAVGVLVCADAWSAEPTASLAAQGARLLVSAAAWPPEPHGPEGCWQRRSLETGLALLVCNRFGAEPGLDFADAATVVVDAGVVLLTHAVAEEALILVDWRPDTGRVVRVRVEAGGG